MTPIRNLAPFSLTWGVLALWAGATLALPDPALLRAVQAGAPVATANTQPDTLPVGAAPVAPVSASRAGEPGAAVAVPATHLRPQARPDRLQGATGGFDASLARIAAFLGCRDGGAGLSRAGGLQGPVFRPCGGPG